MTDEKLYALLRRDANAGLEVAVAAYGGIVKAVLQRVLGGRTQDVEDCMGTVFCRLWEKSHTIDLERGSLKSWLCRTARNTAVDLLRREGVPLLSLEEETLGLPDNLAEQAIQSINAALVQRMVNEMEEPDRMIFIRRYYYVERIRCIAEAVGLSEKAIERRLARGRARLRDALLKEGVILDEI